MDRQTNRQAERQTDESDFIGRCRTNAERPIIGSHEFNLMSANFGPTFIK